MILLPPEGAGTVDRQERTCLPGGVLTDHYLAIITVSAPMFCAHRLNLQLSVSLLRRLAIVLSPVQNARRFVLPPEGAVFLEPTAGNTWCFLQYSAFIIGDVIYRVSTVT